MQKYLFLVIVAAGCLSQDPPNAAEDPAPPAEVHDGKGNVWHLVGPAQRAPIEAPIEAPRSDIAALRPVSFYQGNQYELDISDEALAQRYQTILDRGPLGGQPWHPVDDSPAPPLGIFGLDDRVPVGYLNSPRYPASAVGAVASSGQANFFNATGECSMTMIGPSTAISAAHCFYTANVGWQSGKTWAFGVTSIAGVGIYQAYPNYYGCYWVTIPAGAMTSTNELYDYAVIEFSNSQAPICNLSPGYTTGWYGWWTASDAQIVNTPARVSGYPGTFPPNYGNTYFWPTQFTQIAAGSTQVSGPYPEYAGGISFTLDVSPGNSGSAIAQELFTPGDRYVTGIVQLASVSFNVARRIDSTVRAFVLANSAL